MFICWIFEVEVIPFDDLNNRPHLEAHHLLLWLDDVFISEAPQYVGDIGMQGPGRTWYQIERA